MREHGSALWIALFLLILCGSVSAGDHWVLKPCGTANGACFLPVSFPVYPYFEPDYLYGWGSQWDDGDGVPEAIILFPNIPREGSWEKIATNGTFQTHYSNSGMPFLWCDARNFTSYDDFATTMFTWGFNLVLLDIANDLTAIWTNPVFKDLKGCWVGEGRYHDMSSGPSDRFNWEAQVVGVARSSTGEVYDVRMKLQLQVKDVPAPEGAHLEHIEFLSSPDKK